VVGGCHQSTAAIQRRKGGLAGQKCAAAGFVTPTPTSPGPHNLAQLLHRLAGQPLHVCGLGDVGGHAHHLAARVLPPQLGRRLLHRLRRPAADHHIVAQGQKLAGQVQAQPAGAAGDDNLRRGKKQRGSQRAAGRAGEKRPHLGACNGLHLHGTACGCIEAAPACLQPLRMRLNVHGMPGSQQRPGKLVSSYQQERADQAGQEASDV
jgi:hypothetical protein